MTDCERLLGIQRFLNGKHRNSLLKIFCRLIDHQVVTRALLHFELQRRAGSPRQPFPIRFGQTAGTKFQQGPARSVSVLEEVFLRERVPPMSIDGSDARTPWGLLPIDGKGGESAVAFSAFRLYSEMPPDERSLRRDRHNSRRPSNDGQAPPRQPAVRPMGTHVSPCPMRVPTVRPR